MWCTKHLLIQPQQFLLSFYMEAWTCDFQAEQEGPKTSSMSDSIIMLQGKSVLGFSPESLSYLTILK